MSAVGLPAPPSSSQLWAPRSGILNPGVIKNLFLNVDCDGRPHRVVLGQIARDRLEKGRILASCNVATRRELLPPGSCTATDRLRYESIRVLLLSIHRYCTIYTCTMQDHNDLYPFLSNNRGNNATLDDSPRHAIGHKFEPHHNRYTGPTFV